jgi:hypothetical protein
MPASRRGLQGEDARVSIGGDGEDTFFFGKDDPSQLGSVYEIFFEFVE